MKKRRVKYLLLIAVFTCINAYILFQRNNGYKYFPFKTYSELYVLDSILYLKDIHFNGDSLQLFFSKPLPGKNYSLNIDNVFLANILTSNANEIIVPLQKDFHIYKLSPGSLGIDITLKVDHNTTSKPTVNELLFCSLPGPQTKVSPYETWSNTRAVFSTAEYSSAAELLKKYTNAYNVNTDSARVLAIEKFVASLQSNPNGIDAYELGKQIPLQQIDSAMQQKAQLLCGNYATIVYFLCCTMNMTNRVVTYRGPAGNWQYGMHYFNEIYLREKQQWVLVDAMNNIYMPHDSLRYYNAVDVKKMTQVNGFAGKKAFSFLGDSIREVAYDSINEKHIYYNQSGANLCFLHPGADLNVSAWKNFIEFYSFSRDYDFYSDANSNDWFKIIVKEIAFVVLAILLIAYFVFEIKQRVNKKVK